MALIKCPECAKEISDKSTICVGCGFPIKDHFNKSNTDKRDKMFCPDCGTENYLNSNYCQKCGFKISDHKQFVSSGSFNSDDFVIEESFDNEEEFNGVYRNRLFGGPKKVFCPACNSSDCVYHQQQKWVPGKKKTKYSANLNPLKPFTLVNKKEKVIREDELVTETLFKCNRCGWVFR